jgi:hypothetical protein
MGLFLMDVAQGRGNAGPFAYFHWKSLKDSSLFICGVEGELNSDDGLTLVSISNTNLNRIALRPKLSITGSRN